MKELRKFELAHLKKMTTTMKKTKTKTKKKKTITKKTTKTKKTIFPFETALFLFTDC